jgi:hypothetical protein
MAIIEDLAVLAGLICLTIGIGQLSTPAGWIFAGLAVVGVAVLVAKANGSEPDGDSAR